MPKNEFEIPAIPMPKTSLLKTPMGRWLCSPELKNEKHEQEHHSTAPWYKVLWLTGVDYFSTLGYQPGIALLAAGSLAPIATLILVFMTLFCALPTYANVAKRSFGGQGSVAMLENLLKGWYSKIFVLILLGFVATDFVITITLSAADAALHVVENPLLHSLVGDHHFALTLILISLLALVFIRGFSEAIGIAILIAVPYIFFNFLVLIKGSLIILDHPDMLTHWHMDLMGHGDWTGILLISALIFPKLALGMSGFETGVSVMPLVKGSKDDHQKEIPLGRIRNTKKLLTTAALIMSTLLLLSSFVTALLIPVSAYQKGGVAEGRAISYLAHELMGHGVGTAYDIVTILVLWFAGASAMAGLLHLIPRYLPRFGMSPRWVAFRRPLVVAIFTICVLVTWIFNASIEAQGNAYATGVLVLMLSSSFAVALAFWRERQMPKSIYFWVVTAIFAYTLIDNVIMRIDGLIIALTFTLFILIVGIVSRWSKSLDLRVENAELINAESKILWEKICNKKIHLITLAKIDADRMDQKLAEFRKYYRLDGPVAFIHVELSHNRSEFTSKLKVSVTENKEKGYCLIDVSGAPVIANTIAYMSELINPISICISLTRANLMTQAFRYLLWGEGETGLSVYRVLLRYWDWTPEEDVRPLIFLMSD
ncbi:MAG: hypothetical protein KBD63_01110 [Bacteriovoracaceae bacterium]|nr:hypothetical protein [Bacteriovoracaceae bacterium]